MIATLVLLSVTRSGPAETQPAIQVPMGRYYRGTAKGEDHDLFIRTDRTLELINGGCFRRDPPIGGKWRPTSRGIAVIGSPKLIKTVGSILIARRVDGVTILVPNTFLNNAEANAFGTWFAFWPIKQRSLGLKRSNGDH